MNVLFFGLIPLFRLLILCLAHKSRFSPSYRFIHIVFDHILNIWYIHISTLSNIHRESPYNLSFFIPASLWVFSCYMQGSDCDKLEKQWDLLRTIFNIISATTTLTIDDSGWFSTPSLFNIKYQECIWSISWWISFLSMIMKNWLTC